MERKNITLILAVVVLAVAAGLYFAANVSNTPAPIAVTPAPQAKPATVKITSIVAPDTSNLASAAEAATAPRTVTWESQNFPKGATIDVNLIRKVSNSPLTYQLVRGIASNVSNAGQATWVPASNENTDDLYIEVVCSNSYPFKAGCTVVNEPIKAF